MKKILYSVVALGLTLTSCDMDLNEAGKITDTESITNAEDVLSYRNNVYSSFRALTSGSYVTLTELEMDKFLGTIDNGFRGQYFSTANLSSSNDDITSNYFGCYRVMKNINFALEKAQGLIDGGTLSDDDTAAVNRYVGELKFFRAYIYYWLFDHYCQAYDESKADQEGLGLQLVSTYDPTGDTSKYPGRSSMKVSIEFINADLTDAFNAMVEFEKTDNSNCAPNASYISSYAVAALQSRVALLSKDYRTSIDKANYVINSGIYPLTEGNDYIDMWYTDSGSELIMVPFVDQSEVSYVGSFFNTWNYSVIFPIRVDYLPTYATLDAYETGDIRFEAFFAISDPPMQFGDIVTNVFYFNKFPGNATLNTGSSLLYKNKPKPFRTSELYLNVAEASAALSLDNEANAALNAIRTARIEGYQTASYSGSALVDAIRDERAKELIGEGFRMSDLRRWGLGYTRDASFPILPIIEQIYLTSTTSVSFQPNDYRYVWPIPKHQMEINPQLEGQQNPGYGN